MNQFLILGSSPFDILDGRMGDMSRYSGHVGGNDIFYIIRVILFILAIISLLCTFCGMVMVQKAQMIPEKKQKIKRILVIVALASFSVIGFNILKSFWDHSFGYYRTVHYYY